MLQLIRRIQGVPGCATRTDTVQFTGDRPRAQTAFGTTKSFSSSIFSSASSCISYTFHLRPARERLAVEVPTTDRSESLSPYAGRVRDRALCSEAPGETSPNRVRNHGKRSQLGLLLQPAHIYHIHCISAKRKRLSCSSGWSVTSRVSTEPK